MEEVLFTLPVTRRWIKQATLGLTLIGHASMRGVMEFMRDLVGVSISLGTVHNIHQAAAQQAIAINDSVDLWRGSKLRYTFLNSRLHSRGGSARLCNGKTTNFEPRPLDRWKRCWQQR